MTTRDRDSAQLAFALAPAPTGACAFGVPDCADESHARPDHTGPTCSRCYRMLWTLDDPDETIWADVTGWAFCPPTYELRGIAPGPERRHVA